MKKFLICMFLTTFTLSGSWANFDGPKCKRDGNGKKITQSKIVDNKVTNASVRGTKKVVHKIGYNKLTNKFRTEENRRG